MSDAKDSAGRRRAAREEAQRAEKTILPDLVRRAFALGLSGLFTTEEAFRRALGDTVPQDWVDFAVDQSDRTRSELTGRLAEELARVVENMDLEDLLRRILAEHRIEIRAELTLEPRRSGSAAGAKRGKASTEVKVVRGGRRK